MLAVVALFSAVGMVCIQGQRMKILRGLGFGWGVWGWCWVEWIVWGWFCVAEVSNSKLSVHAGGLSTETSNFIQATKPRVVKLLDPGSGAASQVKALSSGTQVVCRVYLPNQPIGGNVTAAVESWWSTVHGSVESNKACDYVEGYNEVELSQWYVDFELARLQFLQTLGIKASVGNFGVGHPDVTNASAIAMLNPLIDAVIASEGVLGLHEYSSPTMSGCVDNSTGLGWLTLRYRRLVSFFPTAPNIVISESGIDAVGGQCGGPNLGGWLQLCPTWQSMGWGDSCTHSYLHTLAWYDQELRKDQFVLGTTIFQADCPGWDNYDITTLFPDLTTYMNAQ